MDKGRARRFASPSENHPFDNCALDKQLFGDARIGQWRMSADPGRKWQLIRIGFLKRAAPALDGGSGDTEAFGRDQYRQSCDPLEPFDGQSTLWSTELPALRPRPL